MPSAAGSMLVMNIALDAWRDRVRVHDHRRRSVPRDLRRHRSAASDRRDRCSIAAILSFSGHFTLQPNEARLLILFGPTKAPFASSGFHWANPFYSRYARRGFRGAAARQPMRDRRRRAWPWPTGRRIVYKPLKAKISLRAHNFNSEKLKVNDKRGNPSRSRPSSSGGSTIRRRPLFDVEDYESYVQVQSESAIRSIASAYAYDSTARATRSRCAAAATRSRTSSRRSSRRGSRRPAWWSIEARLTHLAYAPEIAQAMLRRQQAEAVIAARTKIVVGAVSMVRDGPAPARRNGS